MTASASKVTTVPASTRCDRTAAWAALAGHFEAHGRGFDLREAFARDLGLSFPPRFLLRATQVVEK